MVIREAVPQDGPAIARVQVRSWRAAYRGIVPQDFLDAMETERRGARWSERIDRASRPGAGTLVAEGPEGTVAFAGFGPQQGEGAEALPPELEAFYSVPEVWGSGVNGRLIRRVHEAITAAGHTGAVLWVLRDNPRARRFYASHGWEADGTVTEEGPINGVVLPRMRYRRSF